MKRMTITICLIIIFISNHLSYSQQVHHATLPSNQASILTADAGNTITTSVGNSENLIGTANGGTPPYSYAWSPGTGLSNSMIDTPILTVGNSSTNYTLIVTDVNGCTAIDELQVNITITDLGSMQKPFFSIYPDPASEYIVIEADQLIISIIFFDAQGREILHEEVRKNSFQIDITSIPRGMYFTKVSTKRGVQTAKINIQ